MDIYQLPTHERPCADFGLTSYRLRGPFGWIMIGARDHEDAMLEAARSTPAPRREALQIWNGTQYEDVDWGRLYHLVAINERTGRKHYLTRYPMPHHDCCVMRRKQAQPAKDVRIQLEEVPE
ncbi:hypothetical protein [Burkholderia sp. MBR-1]|uniref:hypothetical protein n=1 Tax=Burkholderia sp. MBR-1 TaxID=2732364 RepID=UPI0015EFB42D|nr:hypothetical protein [Burkholderia sp. MBR-1]QMI49907.1 hypothetical protein MBR110_31095 [Burkholderia sp. MBR-1]